MGLSLKGEAHFLFKSWKDEVGTETLVHKTAGGGFEHWRLLGDDGPKGAGQGIRTKST